MEPEVQSLETSEMVMVAEDQSENHSSSSDIIHLEAELHERVESDEEEEADLQSSMLSMLVSDRELADMRAEMDVMSSADHDLRPPETVELLMSVEEPRVEEIEMEEASSQPIFPHTSLLPEPSDFTLASIPIPEIIAQVLDHPPSPQELPQTHATTFTTSDEVRISESGSTNASVSQGHTRSSTQEVVSKAEPEPATSGTSPFELPVLLVGGATLVAVVGVLTYALSRK
ncbi:bcl-2-like protein 13 [Xyrauchen texanus]|uniref:bcl-2-like protein 13 n=1 Tax=Xyrauchen texanus TaxID=154827 RepID=UPI002242281D|nr:bcl-2-like protein 13 [Xyrauchen texanus]